MTTTESELYLKPPFSEDHRCLARRSMECTGATRSPKGRSARVRVYPSIGFACSGVISRYPRTVGAHLTLDPLRRAAEKRKMTLKGRHSRSLGCRPPAQDQIKSRDRISCSSLEHHDRQVIDRVLPFRELVGNKAQRVAHLWRDAIHHVKETRPRQG